MRNVTSGSGGSLRRCSAKRIFSCFRILLAGFPWLPISSSMSRPCSCYPSF